MENLVWNPGQFIYNLKYMGVGMLGVFIIVGIIIAATYATNKITNNLAKRRREREESRD